MRFISESEPAGPVGRGNRRGMLHSTATEPPVRAGRPTREQAHARQVALQECALAHFLDRGYDGATIEAIAADVNMTKRTIYARYPDKAALFGAAIRHGAGQRAVSTDVIAACRKPLLQDTLIALATLRIGLVADPQGAKLQRLINTESYRFPEIFQIYYGAVTTPTLRFLAKVLEVETREGRLSIDDPMLTANVFMSMVVGGPVRSILAGHSIAAGDLDQRVRFAIRLFLKGAEPR